VSGNVDHKYLKLHDAQLFIYLFRSDFVCDISLSETFRLPNEYVVLSSILASQYK
jgi:hypothetical protein